MTEPLTQIGLHFDDLNKLRVVEPSVSLQSNQLKDECKAFIGTELETEKMKALGVQNMLQSLSRMRELRKQQLKDLIKENTLELERLRVRHQSLIKMEQERQDLIDLLVFQR